MPSPTCCGSLEPREVKEMPKETREPVVRPFEIGPGAVALTRMGNVLMRPLIRSRAGRGMHELTLLSFSGRRPGRGTRYRSRTTSSTATGSC